MTADVQTETDEPRKWSPWAIAAAVLLLMMFGVIAVGMIRGCFVAESPQAADEAEKKKKDETEKQEKAPFNIDPPVVLPSEPKVASPPVKPGHWAVASQTMRANYRDFVGDSNLSIVNNQNRPYPVAGTPYFVRASRPVLLSKGKPKSTETTFFFPQPAQPVHILLDLEERGLGALPQQARTQLALMPSYQYHFVVLAKTPSRYSFIKTLDSVKVPFNGEAETDNTEPSLHYLVVELGADQIASLPDNPLTWTSIAYLLWDEIDPGEPFPADQKRALVDWIHWGGQLIISGPDSLDLLKGSFLEPYLPATSGGAQKLAAGDPSIAAFNAGWIISSAPAPSIPLLPASPWSAAVPLQAAAPWSAIKLNLATNAKPNEVSWLPNTGQLFAERRVGRGRVVVSAIKLAERDFINWRSGFESFFNACLLRRPPRRFDPGYFGGVTAQWASESLKNRRLDAALNSKLLYFARDLGVATSYRYEESPDGQQMPQIPAQLPPQIRARLQAMNPAPPREYRAPEHTGGMGAWNDFSPAAKAARGALREAAGVEVPDAGFVVLCLAAYLITLVPLNWLIFHTLGRVEWAWIAAPLIAITGTWVIVQRAQLDIGFVRAQTEIGILEQQPDHPRAHLSRYTALYTSLSTTYDIDFKNMTTLIAPFPSESTFQLLSGQGLAGINFQRYDMVRLAGLPISSNSTGMVHSEQMFSLDGPIAIGSSGATGSDQIENRSKFELHSVCVVRKPSADEVRRNRGQFNGRWIGNLLPGQSAPLSMASISQKTPFATERADDARLRQGTRLNLEPMFRLALDSTYMEAGETRLVARIDEVLPGETINPSASQVRGATLVVAHLRYAPLPPPEKDRNTRQDIKADEPGEGAGPIEL